ncbi:hypothetical protein [Methylocella sp. CPCC 101449]|uniref:hypothetical protein n=1 Tax=Methylocella sp. CPCC 101449 TaxID=2987531 RepID=UPI00288E1783|nr:hypothetical protein [Methylocella sp. CPCC 101449]MDT2019836.1 hypothetical protein [Methylocella sp. CPCC 101449]
MANEALPASVFAAEVFAAEVLSAEVLAVLARWFLARRFLPVSFPTADVFAASLLAIAVLAVAVLIVARLIVALVPMRFLVTRVRPISFFTVGLRTRGAGVTRLFPLVAFEILVVELATARLAAIAPARLLLLILADEARLTRTIGAILATFLAFLPVRTFLPLDAVLPIAPVWSHAGEAATDGLDLLVVIDLVGIDAEFFGLISDNAVQPFAQGHSRPARRFLGGFTRVEIDPFDAPGNRFVHYRPPRVAPLKFSAQTAERTGESSPAI